VKAIQVDGQAPLPPNLDYPIVRPLYLLWWPGKPAVADFIAWTSTQEAEAAITRCFGRRRALTLPASRN
jgi:ABC-type phosphate transport system substrate-binding protein